MKWLLIAALLVGCSSAPQAKAAPTARPAVEIIQTFSDSIGDPDDASRVIDYDAIVLCVKGRLVIVTVPLSPDYRSGAGTYGKCP